MLSVEDQIELITLNKSPMHITFTIDDIVQSAIIWSNKPNGNIISA